MDCDQPKQFLVVTPGGVAIHATPDPYGAAHYAAQLGSYQWLAPTAEDIAYDRPELQWAANPRRLPAAGPVGPPSRASELSQLPRLIPESIMGMSLRQAEAALRPFFEEANEASIESARWLHHQKTDEPMSAKQIGTASVATSVEDWVAPGKGWLSDNAKLQKRKGTVAVALGLNLLPELSAFSLRSMAGVRFGGVDPPRPLSVDESGRLIHVDAPPNATFCQGASKECMRSCLVNTGQNAASMRANYSKFARTKALVERPHEFLRVLGEALQRYSDSTSEYFGGTNDDVLRLVRLNVLSDLPWEEIAPWLFRRFDRLTPYEYTKVPGRPLMSPRRGLDPRQPVGRGRGYYDLSFSYSGANAHACESEFQRGRRIVQVYVAPGYLVKQSVVRNAKVLASEAVTRALAIKDKKDPLRLEAEGLVDQIALQAWLRLNPLPATSTIGGRGSRVLPVVDGDETDFRPLDPTDVIVGLRWKPAKVVVDEETGKREEDVAPRHFVLYGDVVDTDRGPMYRVAETPSSAGGSPGAKVETAVRFIREARRESNRLRKDRRETMLGALGELWQEAR